MKITVCLLVICAFEVQGQILLPKAIWTKWLDRDDPSVTGDWETVINFKPRPCFGRAIRMEVRMKCDPSVTIASVGERISVGPDYGLLCLRSSQPDNTCFDYSVNYILPRLSKTFDRDDHTGTGDWETKNLETGPAWKNGRFIYWYANDNNYGLVHERLELGPRYGLVCKNADQPDKTCQDYEVRFLCPWFSPIQLATFKEEKSALEGPVPT